MTPWLDLLLWLGAAVWTLFLLQCLTNLILVPDLSRAELANPESWPFVSIIVPARDEQRRIRKAVSSFCSQDYPNFEVVVVDDRSTDETPKILAELRQQFANLKVLHGEEPPAGWLGKPNALRIGLTEAKGDWILMVDADTVHGPSLLRRGMAYTTSRGAAMGVLHARLDTSGVLEAILMSATHFFFFAATPLFLAARSRAKIFSAGSPVFNLIRRDALDACGGFACIKQAVVDDLEIGACVKRAGYPLAVGFGGDLINHRMYHGARDTVLGFCKTTYPTIRNAPWILPLYYLAGATIFLLPYAAFVSSLLGGTISVPATISLLLMHLILAILAIRFRHPWYVVFCSPIRELGWWWIFARSFIVYHRKGLVWRDRTYPTST